METIKKAQKGDWKTNPMPEKREIFSMSLSLSEKEYEILQYGLIPQEMEDKWFLYFEDDTLYFHRSWTGICVYEVHFSEDHQSAKVIVNRDPDQYRQQDPEQDKAVIQILISGLVRNPEREKILEQFYKALGKGKKS